MDNDIATRSNVVVKSFVLGLFRETPSLIGRRLRSGGTDFYMIVPGQALYYDYCNWKVCNYCNCIVYDYCSCIVCDYCICIVYNYYNCIVYDCCNYSL